MKTAVATAIALATAALTLAPTTASAEEPASIREQFAAVEDGPAPTTTVTGGRSVTNYSGPNADAAPYIRGGYLTTARPDNAVGGSYRIADLDADVTTVGASFAFSPYSAGGGVLCLSIQADSIATTPSVPVSPLHFIISPTDWGLDVNSEAGTGVEGLVGGTFDKPLAADSNTLHRVELTLDRAANKVRITLPDGSVHTFTNPALGLAGDHVYVEPFKSPNAGPLAEQPDALVSEWWADTAPVRVAEEAVAVPRPRTPAPTLVAEVAPTPTLEQAVAPTPAATTRAAAPERPRGVRSVRHGARVVTKWRATDADVRVKCGKVSKVVDGLRATMRTNATRCKARTVSDSGASRWVVTGVR